MLDSFDWIRRSETGAELIATLEFLETVPDLLTDDLEPGPPFSALGGPCRRCWVHAPITTAAEDPVPIPYCRPCQAIRIRAAKLGGVSRGAVVVWGHANRLPRRLLNKQGFQQWLILTVLFLLTLMRVSMFLAQHKSKNSYQATSHDLATT